MTPELEAKLCGMRHHWGNLSRDLVLAVTPQPLGVTPSFDAIMRTYGLTGGELVELMVYAPFRKLLKAETDRVTQLGGRGGLILRFESMLAAVGEMLFARFSNTENPEATKDMLGFFKLLMQSSGVASESQQPITNSNQTLVQFTVPEGIPKLSHLQVSAAQRGEDV